MTGQWVSDRRHGNEARRQREDERFASFDSVQLEGLLRVHSALQRALQTVETLRRIGQYGAGPNYPAGSRAELLAAVATIEPEVYGASSLIFDEGLRDQTRKAMAGLLNALEAYRPGESPAHQQLRSAVDATNKAIDHLSAVIRELYAHRFRREEGS